jgi:hypothetical protein
MKFSRLRLFEFFLLVFGSIVMSAISIKNIIEEENSINGILASYSCSLWKDSKLYSHDIILNSGEEYGMRTDAISCDEVVLPEINRQVNVIYKGGKLLSLKQNKQELLSYEQLEKDVDNASSTVYYLTFFLILITIGNGYKLFHKYKTNGVIKPMGSGLVEIGIT